jgi:hypothetical protein
MKRKKNWCHIKKHCLNLLMAGLVMTLAAGWWGVLYPQLTWNADTCRVVTQDGETVLTEDGEVPSGSALYYEMLNADRGRVRFRFRFAEEIMKCLGLIRGK